MADRSPRLTRDEAFAIARQARRWTLAAVLARICGDVMAGTTPRSGR